MAEDEVDLIPGKHAGQPSFRLGLDDFEDVPILFEDVDEEKFDAAITNFHRVGRPFVHIHTMQKTSFEFILCNLVRGFVVELDEFSNGTRVRILGSPAHSCQFEGLHGTLVVVFHRLLLSIMGFVGVVGCSDCGRAFRQRGK